MGASNRFQEVANFIIRNIPKGRIADIAGGNGELSAILSKHGYTCTVIDPRKSIASIPNVLRIRNRFEYEYSNNFDFLVGLHPDGATESICMATWYKKIPCLIVPCCNHWDKMIGDGTQIVTNFLNKTNIPYRVIYFQFKGANIGYLIRN
jgi:hypothetical protein